MSDLHVVLVCLSKEKKPQKQGIYLPISQTIYRWFLVPDGKLQGFGIVQFKELDDASKAITGMNAKPILGMLHV